jgi:hypothetical protein
MIVDYNDKSFYIKNENCNKEEIKTLGGKWCPNLKDSENNKFGAWIFPMSKKNSVISYFESNILCPPTPKNSDAGGKVDWSIAIQIAKMNIKIEDLEKKVEELENKLVKK